MSLRLRNLVLRNIAMGVDDNGRCACLARVVTMVGRVTLLVVVQRMLLVVSRIFVLVCGLVLVLLLQRSGRDIRLATDLDLLRLDRVAGRTDVLVVVLILGQINA